MLRQQLERTYKLIIVEAQSIAFLFSHLLFISPSSTLEGEMKECGMDGDAREQDRDRLWLRGSYLVLKYFFMAAEDPFITGRKQEGVSLLI